MTITKDEILTLDNNENYFVADVIDYKDNKLALLVNVNKDDESFIVKVNGELLTRVEETEEIYKIFNERID